MPQDAVTGVTPNNLLDPMPEVAGVTPTNLLDQAPDELNELPAFFASLTDAQLAAVWPAAIVHCMSRVSLPQGVLGGLARALACVRTGDRAAHAKQYLEGFNKQTYFTVAGKPRRGLDRTVEAEAVAAALARLPNVGDKEKLWKLCDKNYMKRCRRALELHGEFVVALESKGYGAALWVTRVRPAAASDRDTFAGVAP